MARTTPNGKARGRALDDEEEGEEGEEGEETVIRSNRMYGVKYEEDGDTGFLHYEY